MEMQVDTQKNGVKAIYVRLRQKFAVPVGRCFYLTHIFGGTICTWQKKEFSNG